MYFTYVKPVLEYAAAVWAPHTRRSINKLESVQRRAARFIMNNYCQSSSVSNMLSYLHWKTIESHFKHLRLQMLHKIVYNHVDVSLPSYVTHGSKHTRNAATKFIEIGSTIDAYKFSFFPSLWNTLPEDTINCNNVDS